MQPSATIEHPMASTCERAAFVGAPSGQVVRRADGNASSDATWPLRAAQRAFSELFDGGVHADIGSFRAAQLRSAARRTLSALSADEATRLSRWLTLQLMTARSMRIRRSLSRVDAMLAAVVVATAR